MRAHPKSSEIAVVEISLLSFLKTGIAGPIRLGQTREEVEASLGVPDAKGLTSRKYRQPRIWKYGDVELMWPPREKLLQTIYLDHFDVPEGGRSINLDPAFIRGGLALKDVAALLDETDVAFQEVQHNWSPHRVLETEAGVRILFASGGSRNGLYSISLRREHMRLAP